MIATKIRKDKTLKKTCGTILSRTIVLKISIHHIIPQKCKQKLVISKKVLEKNAEETNLATKIAK